jgi:hypothetical protein
MFHKSFFFWFISPLVPHSLFLCRGCSHRLPLEHDTRVPVVGRLQQGGLTVLAPQDSAAAATNLKKSKK